MFDKDSSQLSKSLEIKPDKLSHPELITSKNIVFGIKIKKDDKSTLC